MDDAVPVAVVKGAGNLSSELARLLFLEAAVRDDVVEHLSTVDELEHHVPVEVCAHDILHAAYVGMVQQTDNGSLSGGSDFFGVVGSFTVGGALVLVLGQSRDDLDGRLLMISTRCFYVSVESAIFMPHVVKNQRQRYTPAPRSRHSWPA